ncbi:MAG: DUF1571 domain-containing protein [Calditrichae bacterium]|nr:DUF1571 domain-containing protein [Calditrichia bacterium]
MRKLIFLINILFTQSIIFAQSSVLNPVQMAVVAFDSLQNYRVTVNTLCCESDENIIYSFKKPAFIRMDFNRPHKGAVLVYNPVENLVRLKPFGLFSFLKLSMDPDNKLITSPKGHTVDKSHFGELLKNVNTLLQNGDITSVKKDSLNNRICNLTEITGKDTISVDGINVYKIWFDDSLKLPLKVEAFDTAGTLLESVLTDDLEINIKLDDDLFDL